MLIQPAIGEDRPGADATSALTDQQVVVLSVAGGDYAVPIGRVQEIVRVPEITAMPDTAHAVQGIINLRGRVLPVIDLAQRLGRGNVEHTPQARVMVVDHATEGIGLLVDGVSEVLRVARQTSNRPTPRTGTWLRRWARANLASQAAQAQ